MSRQAYLEKLEYMQTYSLQILNYMCVPQTDECDSALKKLHEFLSDESKPFKASMIEDQFDRIASYMTSLYVEGICGSHQYKVNSKFEPVHDKAQEEYARKISKAFDAKQKHAPGFDGQGGGVARRSGSSASKK